MIHLLLIIQLLRGVGLDYIQLCDGKCTRDNNSNIDINSNIHINSNIDGDNNIHI